MKNGQIVVCRVLVVVMGLAIALNAIALLWSMGQLQKIIREVFHDLTR